MGKFGIEDFLEHKSLRPESDSSEFYFVATPEGYADTYVAIYEIMLFKISYNNIFMFVYQYLQVCGDDELIVLIQ